MYIQQANHSEDRVMRSGVNDELASKRHRLFFSKCLDGCNRNELHENVARPSLLCPTSHVISCLGENRKRDFFSILES